MRKFEFIEKYKDQLDESFLPARADESSLYDVKCAEDTIIPSYLKKFFEFSYIVQESLEELEEVDEAKELETEEQKYNKNILEKIRRQDAFTLSEVEVLTKKFGLRPTLIPTGIKAKYSNTENLKVYARSSSPLKYLLILGNSVGVIDAKYYNNEDNEGHIMIMVLNLSPVDIVVRKGEKIAQLEFSNFNIVEDDRVNSTVRTGGFGSSDR